MRPTYTSYRQLQSYYEKDVDYKISESPVRSNVGVFSPHGGGIEQGVSELVHAIARDELSWYLFEGTRTTGNWALHISSHLFNEPRGVAFVERHRFVLAIHGKNDDASEKTYLGGRDIEARKLIGEFLRKADFNVPSKTPLRLLGEDPNNICNRCAGGKGVQLEITAGQRQKFFSGDFRTLAGRKLRTPLFEKYVAALRAALHGKICRCATRRFARTEEEHVS
jgi:phage replication-related protein YjqB (UPF0714/DUF867 family)